MKYLLLIILLILISLGTWQIFRLQYKKESIEKLEKEVVTLPETITSKNQYLKVRFITKIKKDPIIYAYADKNGYYVLVIGKIKNKKNVLINIGTTLEKNLVELNGINEIEEQVEGVILSKISKPPMIKNYDEKSDLWFGIDTYEISKKIGLELENYFVWMESTDIKGVKDNGPFKIANRHLEYIITWYSLALFLMFFIIYQYVSTKK